MNYIILEQNTGAIAFFHNIYFSILVVKLEKAKFDQEKAKLSCFFAANMKAIYLSFVHNSIIFNYCIKY